MQSIPISVSYGLLHVGIDPITLNLHPLFIIISCMTIDLIAESLLINSNKFTLKIICKIHFNL